MGWWQRVRTAVSDLFRRNRFERDMEQEIQTFLDLDAQDRERAGASPADARRAARAGFGGVEASRERLRDLRAGAMLGAIARDVRYSIRLLRRSPSFTCAAVLTIALGTFPLAATAGFANWLFFEPAPGVTGADRLVHVELLTRDATGDTDDLDLSYLDLADVRTRVRSLATLAGHSDTSTSIAVPGVDALHVDATYVTHEYFDVLGMRLAAGRSFTSAENLDRGGPPAVVLDHALAASLFGEPALAPGRPVLVGGMMDFTVVGVAPPGFRGLRNDHYTRMWLPGAPWRTARDLAPDERARDARVFDQLIGRLAPDASLDQARAELTAAVRGLARTRPAENDERATAEIRIEHQPGMGFSSPNTRNEIALIVTVFGATGALLLLLAAANVGNLMLFRGARRRGEMAMRSALGASRWQLLRAHLIEVSLISLAGGAVGLLLTLGLAQVLRGVIIPEGGPLELPIDWRVAGLVLAGSMLVGLVFGGAPALVASSSGGLALAVQRASHRGGRRLRSSLTVVQLAVSLALLIGALLLLATMRNLIQVDVGFDPAPVTSARILPHDNGYDDARSLALYRQLIERAGAMPAIDGVSVSGAVPWGGASRARVHVPGDEPDQAISVAANNVSAGYFRVLGLHVLRGRAFTRAEAFTPRDGACGPVVLSELLARRLFGTLDVPDRTVIMTGSECQVVGVVSDVRRPSADWEPILYRPLGRGPLFRNVILARARDPHAGTPAALREAVTSIDPAMPLRVVRSLADDLAFQMAGQRILSSVLGALAAMGLLMAAVGLYGLVAETVVAGTRELAIRIAMGAAPRRILLGVLRRASALAAVGTCLGIGLSAGLSLALRSQLFGVMTLEPWILGSAAALLSAVALVASLAPALRAARVNAVDVLRAD